MAVTEQQVTAAVALQEAAAQDPRPQIRLIAGPGTGKSFTIEARVSWLLQQGIAPDNIFAISFTNASAQDLRVRISQYCESRQQDGADVSVTTMHSLALRMLRVAGLLNRFPVAPLVLDQWEMENIFDAEFRAEHSIGAARCADIRQYSEAFWSTGMLNPPNYIPPNPPITPAEYQQFNTFRGSFEQGYACIPPGAIVRECVEQIQAGLVSPVGLVPIQQLIVDEYQDLNPMDLEFVRAITAGNAVTFVAGDDDQSIYSFRYALPSGIQTFPQTYLGCGDFSLSFCFRCATSILAAASNLLAVHPSTNRIPKNIQSVYANSAPPVAGHVFRWAFANGRSEAAAIAQSCRELISAGLQPNEILILLSNRRVLEGPLVAALQAEQVPFRAFGDQDHLSTDPGRTIYDLARIVCNHDDYVAHRSLLGLLPGVGAGTCLAIRQKVVTSNLNFRDLFYQPLPNGIFSARETNAIRRVAATVAVLTAMAEDDTLETRAPELVQLAQTFGNEVHDAVRDFLASLPLSLTIDELRQFLVTSDDDTRAEILREAQSREGGQSGEATDGTPSVRIMTMHGAKGLSARVVFVPGLEEEVFPGPRRRPYPGLIEEAARLLYVSITRARATCVLSYARRRTMYGRPTPHSPSRFNAATGGAFSPQNGGISAAEAGIVMSDCANL
jgi:superfamily I DNA/RNA helicase